MEDGGYGKGDGEDRFELHFGWMLGERLAIEWHKGLECNAEDAVIVATVIDDNDGEDLEGMLGVFIWGAAKSSESLELVKLPLDPDTDTKSE